MYYTCSHREKLFRNALQSVLLTKFALFSTTWIRNALQSGLRGEIIRVLSSCQAGMVINLSGVFRFKDTSRFATSLSARFLVCPC